VLKQGRIRGKLRLFHSIRRSKQPTKMLQYFGVKGIKRKQKEEMGTRKDMKRRHLYEDFEQKRRFENRKKAVNILRLVRERVQKG